MCLGLVAPLYLLADRANGFSGRIMIFDFNEVHIPALSM